MIRRTIQVEIAVMAESREAAGRLADRVVVFVHQEIEKDFDLKYTMGTEPVCIARIQDYD